MPVPSSITDLSTTAISNSPSGSESPITADDYLRTISAFVATLRDGKGQSAEATVASASTADIGAASSPFVQITGTTTITSFGTTYGGARYVRFAAALTLTHNATTLILPGGANITTAAGDMLVAVPTGNPGSGWRVVAYSNASGVQYAPAGTGAVATTVQTKLRESVSVKDFGAVGDGVTDDTAAVQAALSSGAKVITGSGLTYLVSSTLNGAANTTLRDAIFTAPALASSQYLLSFVGTDGTPQTLGTNYAEGVFGMTVPNGAAFTVGGWAFLASNEYWAAASSDNVTYGEYVQVTAISGNDLTFGQSTLLKYETTASATITPVNLMENIRLENVKLIGPVSTGNQSGVLFNRCGNVHVSGMQSEDFDHSHIAFVRSVRATVRESSGSRTGVAESLDYGVVVSSGCYDILVDGYRGDAMRHIITVGGSSGVSRHISAVNCRGYNLTDGGMDSHSAVHEHTFANNFLHFSDDADPTMDGIIVQGSAPIITGNQIYNPKRHGIAWQPETLSAFGGVIAGVFANNRVEQPRNTGSTSGVVVSQPSVAGVASIQSANIANNQASGFSNTVLVQATAATIKNLSITECKSTSPARGRGIYVAASGADVDGVSVIGGHYETDSVTTNPVIDLFGVSPYFVKNWRVIGANMKRGSSGTIGLRLLRSDNGFEYGCTTDNVTTKYSVDADSTGTTLDRSKSNVVTHSVSTTYTVLPQDRNVILNRAATVTLTLPDATKWLGRELFVKTIQAQAVDSASANVAPIGDSVAGTAILPATDGAWALLISNGTNWIIMQRGA